MTDEPAAEATPAPQTPSVSPPVSGLPEDVIPVIPVRNLVQFPGVVLPVTVGRARSGAAAQEAARTERPVGILLQRDEAVEDPTGADMPRGGTTAGIPR
ncbi:hypothetical protein GAY28_37745 [Azospirillum brasilense]|nr:hypothetical protein [Azospirillum brasilense]